MRKSTLIARCEMALKLRTLDDATRRYLKAIVECLRKGAKPDAQQRAFLEIDLAKASREAK